MPRTEGERNLGQVTLGLAALLFLLLSITPITNNDTWMHVVKGRWIVENMAYPDADPFSFMTGGRSDTAADWLGGVVLALVDRVGGANGLILLKTIVLAAAFLLIARMTRRRLELRDVSAGARDADSGPRDAGLVALASSLGLALIVAHVRFLERPEMFSFLFLAFFLDRLDRATDLRSLALTLIPAQWLWTQTHGSFVLGYALVGLWFAFRRTTWSSVGSAARACLFFIALVAVSAIHPEGPRVILFPFTHLAPQEMEGLSNFEWEPLFSGGVATWSTATLALCLQAIVLVMGAATLVRRGRMQAWEAGVLALLLLLALRHHRNGALFALAAIPGVALTIRGVLARGGGGGGDGDDDGKGDGDAPARSFARTLSGLIPLAIAALLVAACASTAVRGWPITKDAWKRPGFGIARTAPVAGMNFMRDAEIKGRGFTAYTFASYALYAQYPEVTVFIDSRNRSIYPPEVYREYQSARTDKVRALTLLGKYDIDFAWIPFDARTLQSPMAGVAEYLRREDRWALVHIDDNSLLYVREGGANDALIHEAPRDPNSAHGIRLQLGERAGGAKYSPYRAIDPLGYRQGLLDGRPDKERAAFDRETKRLMGHDPESRVALLLRAEALIAGGFPVKAIVPLDKLLALDPEHPYGLLNRASLARTAGDFDLEEELVARFKRLYPGKLPD